MWHEYEHLRNVFSRARFGVGKKDLNGCRTRAGLGYYSVGRGSGSDRKIWPDPCSNTHTHTHTSIISTLIIYHTHKHTHSCMLLRFSRFCREREAASPWS